MQKVRQKETNIKPRRKINGSNLKTNLSYLLMTLPGALLLFIFCYMPIAGIVIAFKDINYAKGIFGSDWVGLKNFEFLFKSPDLYVILRNTLGYNFVNLILGMILPTGLAICLSQLRNKRGSKVYQTIIMLPHFISWIIVTYIVAAFLDYNNGMVNHILMSMGLEKADWYSNTKFWPFFLIFINQWKGIGYSSVVYLATIAGIDTSLYEAASIDGANRRQQIWHITIPELSSVVIIMTIMNIGKILNADFSLFYNVPRESGALLPVTNVISTYVYRALMLNGDIGMSSAAGFFQSVVGFILVMTTNAIVNKIDSEKAMF